MGTYQCPISLKLLWALKKPRKPTETKKTIENDSDTIISGVLVSTRLAISQSFRVSRFLNFGKKKKKKPNRKPKRLKLISKLI